LIYRVIKRHEFQENAYYLKERFLRKLGSPRLEIGRFFCLYEPDQFAPGSTPANVVIALLWVKRETSPISAIN